MGKSKRNSAKQAIPEVTNAMGLDAAMDSPYRSFNMFPLTDRRNVSLWGRNRIIARSRDLFYNSPEVRAAVKTLGMLVGSLKPLPQTNDKEWNELAAKAFRRRTENPFLFDNSGALNFMQLQSYAEEQAIVDGDVLIVLTRTPDGGGGVAVYPADQVRDEANGDGVITTKGGRPIAYNIMGRTGQFKASVDSAVLYRHSPDPTDPRGLTDLIAAITTSQDVREINSYNKAAVKLAASFGIIEVVDKDVKRTDIKDLKGLRNGQATAPCGCQAPDAPQGPLVVNGVNAISMSPGHDLKTIHDTRPSNETRNFARDLVDSIAYSVGLDPEILYRVKEMGSASARFSIAKCKDWARPRVHDKEILCQRIWNHVIACEIDSGRLRPCRDLDTAFDVKWVSNAQWSIDRGRDASSSISLMREGLMSRDTFCLENYGTTYAQVADENAKAAAELKAACERYGVEPQLVAPGEVGSVPLQTQTDSNTEEK